MKEVEKVGKLFDYVADAKLSRPFPVEILQEHLNGSNPKDNVVLDAGCGMGEVVFHLSKMGCKGAVGIDVSHGSLLSGSRLVAQEELTNASFLRADIQRLPFRNGSFDAIFCYGALEYVPDSYRAIEEFIRTAKKKSTIVLALSRRRKTDLFLGMARKTLVSTLPFSWIDRASRAMEFVLSPFKRSLRRCTSLSERKSLRDIIVEGLFSPVYKTHRPQEIKKYFECRGFSAELKPYGARTMFLVKATRG